MSRCSSEHESAALAADLLSRAAARYLDELDAEPVTRQNDIAVASFGSGRRARG